jgi:hypothetical protein
MMSFKFAALQKKIILWKIWIETDIQLLKLLGEDSEFTVKELPQQGKPFYLAGF